MQRVYRSYSNVKKPISYTYLRYQPSYYGRSANFCAGKSRIITFDRRYLKIINDRADYRGLCFHFHDRPVNLYDLLSILCDPLSVHVDPHESLCGLHESLCDCHGNVDRYDHNDRRHDDAQSPRSEEHTSELQS